MSGLEVIGGTAAVSQLLGQAITIIQKIYDAREKVHGASNRLDGHEDQLENLLSTLRLVQDEAELQTPAIQEQIQVIVELGKELQGQLDAFAARLGQSKAKQYKHALTSGDRDEKRLEDLWTRLDRAKADLTARIVTAHVGLSGSMRAGFTAALAIVQRVDRNVQQVLAQRLSVAIQLEGRSTNGENIDRIPLTDQDVRALNLVDRVSWVDNEAFEDADMFNTNLVDRQVYAPTERLYKGNKAHGRSTVLQGNADAAGIAAILRAKRG
ncbi:hypothetical protein CC80DRAFT_493040 [Byssothecium circinans]|uniref:Uncharacterized protein n=1 Tax=Byssothecium circinans TaxID=147558 RepID=A0A6A5TUW6_9PLEO|nr:hypothetical protein CC80DRAFT_493040 [Byssothecium circinans]